MKIAERSLNFFPELTETEREMLECYFTGGVSAIAYATLPGFEKTTWVSGILLGAAQNFGANREYNQHPQSDTTNWPRLIRYQLLWGAYTMTAKVTSHYIMTGNINYDSTMVITSIALNTVSASLFRYFTKD